MKAIALWKMEQIKCKTGAGIMTVLSVLSSKRN